MGKETKGMVFDLTGLTSNKNKAPVLKSTLEKPKGFNKTERLQHEIYQDWRHPKEPVGYLLRKHKQNTFKDKLVTPQNIISQANRAAMERTAKLLE